MKKPPQDQKIDIWFVILIVTVAVAGAVLAVRSGVASNQSSALDAWREIGGALVSGAAVAGLVVWYETRVDRRRIAREEDRDEKAAVAAWTREIDLQMLKVVRHQLLKERGEFLAIVFMYKQNIEKILDQDPQTTTGVSGRSELGQSISPIFDLANEAHALATMQNQPHLAALLNNWLGSPVKLACPSLRGHEAMTAHLAELGAAMALESALWTNLEEAFRAHQESRYGSQG